MAIPFLPALFTLALFCFRVAITPPRPPAAEVEKTLKPEDGKRKADALRNLVAIIKEIISVLLVSELAVALYASSPITSSTAASFLASACPSTIPYLVSPPSATSRLSIGLVLMIVGGTVRAWCYRALGKDFTWEVTKPSLLVTSGPYAWARHPSYPGIWLTMGGSILLLLSPDTVFRACVVGNAGGGGGVAADVMVGVYSVWAVTWCAFLVVRAQEEDVQMKRVFGKEWEAWSAKTRAMFVPFFW